MVEKFRQIEGDAALAHLEGNAHKGRGYAHRLGSLHRRARTFLPSNVKQRKGLEKYVLASSASRVGHAYYKGDTARNLGQHVRNNGIVAVAQGVENDTTGSEKHTRRVGEKNRVGENSGAAKPSYQRN